MRLGLRGCKASEPAHSAEIKWWIGRIWNFEDSIDHTSRNIFLLHLSHPFDLPIVSFSSIWFRKHWAAILCMSTMFLAATETNVEGLL